MKKILFIFIFLLNLNIESDTINDLQCINDYCEENLTRDCLKNNCNISNPEKYISAIKNCKSQWGNNQDEYLNCIFSIR